MTHALSNGSRIFASANPKLTYTKLAFPLMLGSVAVAHVYLYFMFLRAAIAFSL